jgi:transposase
MTAHALAAWRGDPSDTTDAEWQLIGPYLPVRRDIVDAIRYLDHNSCVWRALPVDFPPWPTVYHYFRAWIRDGTLAHLAAVRLPNVSYSSRTVRNALGRRIAAWLSRATTASGRRSASGSPRGHASEP